MWYIQMGLRSRVDSYKCYTNTRQKKYIPVRPMPYLCVVELQWSYYKNIHIKEVQNNKKKTRMIDMWVIMKAVLTTQQQLVVHYHPDLKTWKRKNGLSWNLMSRLPILGIEGKTNPQIVYKKYLITNVTKSNMLPEV